MLEEGGGRHLALLKRVGCMAGSTCNDLIRDANSVVTKGYGGGGCFLRERH